MLHAKKDRPLRLCIYASMVQMPCTACILLKYFYLPFQSLCSKKNYLISKNSATLETPETGACLKNRTNHCGSRIGRFGMRSKNFGSPNYMATGIYSSQENSASRTFRRRRFNFFLAVITLHSFSLHCFALHSLTLHYITIHLIHYIQFNDTTLHYITLHYITLVHYKR